MDAARNTVAWLERHATYTAPGTIRPARESGGTGHGLVAGTFLHHMSHDSDPHLHVHVAISEPRAARRRR